MTPLQKFCINRAREEEITLRDYAEPNPVGLDSDDDDAWFGSQSQPHPDAGPSGLFDEPVEGLWPQTPRHVNDPVEDGVVVPMEVDTNDHRQELNNGQRQQHVNVEQQQLVNVEEQGLQQLANVEQQQQQGLQQLANVEQQQLVNVEQQQEDLQQLVDADHQQQQQQDIQQLVDVEQEQGTNEQEADVSLVRRALLFEELEDDDHYHHQDNNDLHMSKVDRTNQSDAPDETAKFELAPVELSLKSNRRRKRHLLVDDLKTISAADFKAQMKNSDWTSWPSLELAPPTKRYMRLAGAKNAAKNLLNPGRPHNGSLLRGHFALKVKTLMTASKFEEVEDEEESLLRQSSNRKRKRSSLRDTLEQSASTAKRTALCDRLSEITNVNLPDSTLQGAAKKPTTLLLIHVHCISSIIQPFLSICKWKFRPKQPSNLVSNSWAIFKFY